MTRLSLMLAAACALACGPDRPTTNPVAPPPSPNADDSEFRVDTRCHSAGASITITPSTDTVIVGQTMQLTVRSAAAARHACKLVRWSSSDTAIAEISTTGLLSARAMGRATITANAAGTNAVARVTVTPPAVASVRLVPLNSRLPIGGTATLTATALDNRDSTVTGQTVTWHSRSPGVALVVAGPNGSATVTAVGSGAAKIDVTVGATSATASIAVAAAPAIASGVEYGVHSDLTYDGSASDRATAIQKMVALHAKVSRSSFLWHHIEAKQGAYDWSVTDDVVNRSLANGLDPLMAVYGSPSWANGTSSSTSSYYLYIPQSATTFAAWVQAYAKFMTAAVTRYKGKVKKWELWNEENQHYFWRPTPNLARYVTWYKAVAAAIKAADPNCAVAVGGLVGLTAGPSTDYSGLAFLKGLYAAGVIPQAVAIHPYSNYGPTATHAYQNSFSDVAAIRQVMTSNHQASTPLWITEWGWDVNSVGATTVATYLTQSLAMLASQYTYVTVATYFQLKDVPSYAYGLYDASWRSRPAATAFTTFATAHGQ